MRDLIPPSFYLGTGEDYLTLVSDDKLQELIAQNFNLLTPSNSLKLRRVGQHPHTWDFNQSDWIVNFATKNNLTLRGHLMVWARSIPDWVKDMESYQFSQMLKSYIFETMQRYPQIIDWDVCGEAFNDNGYLRETILSYHLGAKWIHRCLLWAQEARPDASFFYSEFRLQRFQKQESVLKLIQSCLNEGIPLNGISIQLHHNIAGTLKLFTLKDFIRKIQGKGLNVHFGEVTLWNQVTPVGRVQLLSQAIAYSELLRLALDCGITTFNLWGTTDRYSWRFPEREPFLFDSEYQPKPAYHAIASQLTGRGVRAV
ncbi:endo-1,4-beta-xylanase [Oscillatoria sp. HE19RPO]|jgi:endo-1,4-beta-xylanase|uniref:endo-1,4-beta-xylanase n=1 Tax=Oscillatoria sp. HE19RPO TaxID=2954806 RepID=UPI0020C42214|nr:endo-1,4-beta-xylanase [Oscillatoria sp. HE19RPO]